MKKTPRAPSDRDTVPVRPAGPSPASTAALVALGAIGSLWALFLWAELLVSRRGGAAFCAIGDAADCAALWDGAFAGAIHRTTGLPLAAWGLVWGLAAFALPLLLLLRAAEGRPQPALVSAVRFVAAAGMAAVIVFFGASMAAGAACVGCFVMYVLVAGYAGIALHGWNFLGLPEAARGAGFAAAAVAGATLVLLYPGLKTPRSAGESARAAVAAAPAADASGAAPTGGHPRDRLLHEFVASLSAELKQTLSDSLNIYTNAPRLAPPAPRQLAGAADAPVRITEWTDILCSHCAGLHETLGHLRERFPAESFSVDSRQFPLDGACNPLIGQRSESGAVRCLAAKVRLCVEGDPGWSLAGDLFAQQQDLTTSKIYAVAERYMPRKKLDACVAAESTRRALEADVRAAESYDPDATPIVAVNGRKGTSFGPFLYAMVLTGGDAAHPAFRSLPAPNPQAHLH